MQAPPLRPLRRGRGAAAEEEQGGRTVPRTAGMSVHVLHICEPPTQNPVAQASAQPPHLSWLKYGTLSCTQEARLGRRHEQGGRQERMVHQHVPTAQCAWAATPASSACCITAVARDGALLTAAKVMAQTYAVRTTSRVSQGRHAMGGGSSLRCISRGPNGAGGRGLRHALGCERGDATPHRRCFNRRLM